MQRRRRQEDEGSTTTANGLTGGNGSNDNTNSPGDKSSLHMRNFIVDRTTLMLMLEALKRSSDIDNLVFHNSGLPDRSVSLLAEGLPHTAIRSLSLDYNQNSE